jgi:hypothetical protein
VGLAQAYGIEAHFCSISDFTEHEAVVLLKEQYSG